MKQLLASLLLCACVVTSSAQSICNCVPDATCISPTGDLIVCPSGENAPLLYVGVYYDQVFTIYIPTSIAHNGTTIQLAAVRIDDLSGLPQGITWCRSAVEMPAGARSCFWAKGTASVVGQYPIKVTLTPKVVLPFFGAVWGTSYTDSTSLILSVNDTVQVYEPPVAHFTMSSDTVVAGATVSFSDGSCNTPTAWHWEFQGGTPSTSNLQNPTVRYDTVGSYNVRLIVSNPAGYDTLQVVSCVTVKTPAPVASFTPSATTIIAGGSVTFTDGSTNQPTGWHWEFEGGTPSASNEQNPAVQYNEVGNFKVMLVAANATGSDTLLVENCVAVKIPAPVASFTASATSIVAGGSVTFTDGSTNQPTGWHWEFEGGTPKTSTTQHPTVLYSAVGTYDVRLIASNSTGSDTLLVTNYITATPNAIDNKPYKTELSIYPNPSRSSVTIGAEGITKVRIIDAQGRVVITKKIERCSSVSVDVARLQQGVYLVLVDSDAGGISGTMVVER